jgi:Leucine-rich repeat (LRR) protein
MNGPSTVTLTRLPALPASLTHLTVTGNRITNFDSLTGLPNLQWLSMTGSTVTNLPAFELRDDLS